MKNLIYLILCCISTANAQDIVFNVLPQNFNNDNDYNTIMQTIGWFLPRHYSFVGMDEKSFEDDFLPL
jgi:hypothetical protein